MNKHIIIGNLTRDPEAGTTPNGINYCKFTVAARKRYHKEGAPDALFVRVTAWRALGDNCLRYLRKGRKVLVIGEPDVSAYRGSDGNAYATIELSADEVEFLGGPKGETADHDDDGRDEDPDQVQGGP